VHDSSQETVREYPPLQSIRSLRPLHWYDSNRS
jgi:hypothetical protein